MKQSIILTIAISIITGIACNSAGDKKIEFISPAKDTGPKKDYTKVVFASKKDTTCGMPLSAGIGDTLHWNGKVYGFCSKECKDAFVEKLKKEKKLQVKVKP